MPASFYISPRLLVREACAADVGQIHIFLSERLLEFGLDLDHYKEDRDIALIPESYRGGHFGIIEKEGSIMGTFGLYPVDAEIAEVRKMYLAPELRGNGIGKKIMTFLEEVATEKGFRRLQLKTAMAMTAARSLYEKYGYHEVDGPFDLDDRCEVCYIKHLYDE